MVRRCSATAEVIGDESSRALSFPVITVRSSSPIVSCDSSSGLPVESKCVAVRTDERYGGSDLEG